MGLSAPARSDYQTGVDAYSNGNFKLALEEWLPLAEGGDATAQNSVGALYDHGLGVDEDDATAAYWYQLAADQSLPLAMRNIANMYAGGYGVAVRPGARQILVREGGQDGRSRLDQAHGGLAALRRVPPRPKARRSQRQRRSSHHPPRPQSR